MKRPNQVTVAGQKFTFETVTSVDADSWGRTFIGTQRIEITEGLAQDQERDTVLHEVVHVVIRVLGLNRATYVEEERLVAGLTPALLDVLRSNPDLTKYLLEGAGK